MNDDPRVREILSRATDLPMSQRPAFLLDACGDDAALRAEVESLLLALDQADEFLVNQTTPRTQSPIADAPDLIGTGIGPYRLVEKIGEGGMGTVYLAEQEQPVRRRVALKIIKPGMDSRLVIARFEAERQALALMDHSNIARVFDAGTTSTGRPYFVMELVQGVSVTRYCDENRLPPEQRLELFSTICHAVQHAHQKGIIHRDLKPGNVLVTMQDGKPMAKVIDFGIAKAIAQRTSEMNAFTQLGMLVGTPEYMSPEQAGGHPEHTDTRSDVYALGVILYELLTGATPLDRRQLRQAGYDQMMRTIREVEPPKPSARLNSAGEGVASASALRRMEPRKLVKLLAGDLDVIVMKCLEKDRARRYETASGIAQDIARFLNDDPVEACAPSALYVLGKFAWKYRKLLSVIAGFAFLLTGFLVTTSVVFWVLKAEAARQRDIAVSARSAAESAKAAETAAKNEAIRGKDAAEQAKARAQTESYHACIFAADTAARLDNFADAQRFLEIAPAQLRNWEWNYLHALVNPQVLTLGPMPSDRVQYYKDRAEISVIRSDGSVEFYDAQTGHETKTIRGLQERGLRPFIVSPDQQRLIAERRDFSICVLDAEGKELASVPSVNERLTYVYTTLFNRDHSRYITSCRDDQTVRLWDTATCTELMRLSGNAGLVISTVLSPDQSKLLTGTTQGVAAIWDLSTGKCVSSHRDPSGGWIFSAFSPDAKRVVSTTADLTRQGVIWDAATGADLLSLKEGAHTNVNLSADFSPDGKMVAISGGRIATIFDASTGQQIGVLRGHVGRVPGVQFIGDGSRAMTGSNDGTIRVWEIYPCPRPLTFGNADHPVIDARFSPDGQLLTTRSADKSICIYDLTTGKLVSAFSPQAGKILDLPSGADQPFDPLTPRIAVGAGDGTVLVLNSSTGKILSRIRDAGASPVVGAITHDGSRLVTGSANGAIRVWDLRSAKLAARLCDAGQRVDRITISPLDDRMITMKAGGDGQLWDLHAGKMIGVLPGGPRSFAFSGDGRSISIQRSKSGPLDLDAFVFSHDGKSIAAAAGLAAVIFDAVTAREKGQMIIRHAILHSAAFSPDDSKIVVSCEDEIGEIWDVNTFTRLRDLYGHQGSLLGACYSPDGSRILTCSVDKSVRLWSAGSGRQLLALQGPTAPVAKVEFSSDGCKVMAIVDDGTAWVWDSISAEAKTGGDKTGTTRPE